MNEEDNMKEYQLQLLLIFALALFLLLTACAGVDASVLDSAQCKGKGVFGASIAYTMGINAPEWLEIDPENIYDADSAGPLQYLELEYGVQDDIDAKLRLGATKDATSGKFLIKKQMQDDGKRSTAFVVGAAAVKANEDFWEPVDGSSDKLEYLLLSSELQLLLTHTVAEGKHLTMALRGNYHQLNESRGSSDDVTHHFANAGLRLNYMRYYKGFYSVFEVGFEVPLISEELNGVYPWVGMKFGMDFNKKH